MDGRTVHHIQQGKMETHTGEPQHPQTSPKHLLPMGITQIAQRLQHRATDFTEAEFEELKQGNLFSLRSAETFQWCIQYGAR
jgi:hypothetical protein